MSSPSYQVRFYPAFSIACYRFSHHSYSDVLNVPQLQPRTTKINLYHKLQKTHENSASGSNMRYEIVRKVNWPSTCMRNKSTANILLIQTCVAKMSEQDYDLDMADSSSLPSHKRAQLTLQQSNHQKKTKNDLQSEHAHYANHDIWLGFQTMELLAKEADIPPQELNISIHDMIKKGYKENEAAEAHTAKVSYPEYHSRNGQVQEKTADLGITTTSRKSLQKLKSIRRQVSHSSTISF